MARRGRPPKPPKGFGERDLSSEHEIALAAHIARAYYLEERSQVAIGEEIGLSRFQVARLLQLARKEGVVRIEVTNPGAIDRQLSASLQEQFGIRRAIVVSSPTVVPLVDMGRILGNLLAETVREGDIVGLSWSLAIRSMVEQMHNVKPCTVVQLAGQMSPRSETTGSVELVRKAAEVAGGEALPIYAPFLLPSSEATSALLAQPDIARAVAYLDKLDVAVVSIGAWGPSHSVIYDSITESERHAAHNRGVVGDINGRMFDASGETVDHEMDARTLAITFDQLRDVPEVICSSHGVARAQATLSAIRAGMATTWVLDEALARAVLNLAS